jgi:L-2-hydroxyglutarate oxidase LhgO
LTRKGIEFSTNPFEKSESQNDAEPSGAQVLPGTYTARITFNDASAETTIRVHMDPRIEVNENNLAARNTMYERWESNADVASKAVRQMQDAFETLDLVNSRMKDHEGEQVDSLRSMAKDIKATLTELGEHFAGKQVQGILRDPSSVMSMLFTARSYIVSGFNAPDESTRIAMEQSTERLNQVLEQVNAFFSTDWAAFEDAVDEADISLYGKKEQFKLD